MSMLGSIVSKTRQLIELATKLTIIGVPALYFAGWAYLDTYWDKFGIDDGLLGYTGADYIRSGALVLIHSILEGTTWVVIITWVFVPLLVILILIRIFAMPTLFGLSRKFRAFRVKLRKQGRVAPKHRRLARSVDAVVDSAFASVLSFLMMFLFVIGLIYAGVKPSAAKAKADAEKEQAALAKLPMLERNWVLGYAEPMPGRPTLVMQCGGEMCVLLTDERVEVMPRSAMTRMETCRRVGRADGGTFHCIARNAIL